MISAMTKNGVIGRGDELVVNCKDDMKFFKDMTTNNIVIMGSTTHRSIGKKLPNRDNFIISSLESDDEDFYTGIEPPLYKMFTEERYANKDIYIIGGENMYRQFIGICHEVYLTIYDKTLFGETLEIPNFRYFPIDGLKKYYSTRKFVKKVGSYEEENSGTIYQYSI